MPNLRIPALWTALIGSALTTNSFNSLMVEAWMIFVATPIVYLYWSGRGK